MFDIAWSELLIVAIVAIVVVGPKELPGLLRTFGRIVGKLRRHADDFRRQFDETMRETGGEDLKRELDQLRYNNPLNEIRNTIESAAREVTQPPLSLDPAAPTAAAPTPSETPAAPETPAASAIEAAPAAASVSPPAPDNASTPAQSHTNGAERAL